MDFLFIKTKDSTIDIPWTLLELGHHVECVEDIILDPLISDPVAKNKLKEELETHPVDFVISYLFIPDVSNLCEEQSIYYLSWTYDSPLIPLFDNAIYNKHNITFVFDQSECNHLKDLNAPNIHYMPMGVNLSRVGALEITEDDENVFSSDISFIGNLYENNNYNNIIHILPDHLQNELKTYLLNNTCTWNQKKPWPSLSNELTDFMVQNLNAHEWNKCNFTDNQYLGILVLSRKLAEIDRINVLNALALEHKVDLYTTKPSRFLENVTIHNSVDYITEMNKIFYLSKINLNITIPSIETGVPQRVFDIMGCGGFVLSNYQEEMDELFTIGEDIAVYHNLEELIEKTHYYLTHEEERLRIAMNGYIKVRNCYSYTHQLNRILEIALQYKSR